MLRVTSSALCVATLALLGSPAFSQGTTTPGATPPAAPPPAAVTPAQPASPPAAVVPDAATKAPAGTVADPAADPVAACVAEFPALDANSDGFLSAEEAPRDHARSRVDALTPGDQGLTQDEYNQLCQSASWTENVPEEGAPLEGANSFTEEQARDRAMAWNVMDVSALTKDDKGVWRGTGKVNGADVSVAIDYKGNVVTTPAN